MNSNFLCIRLIRILQPVDGEYHKTKAVDLPQRQINRFCLEKTYIQVTNEVSALFLVVDKHQDLLCN